MNRIISKSGGDVFKFAGDAMIVLWPPADEGDVFGLEENARRAVQCAAEIQAVSRKARDFGAFWWSKGFLRYQIV